MDDRGLTSLTPRERECLRLVARDQGTGEIAAKLGLAVGTVHNHIKSARAKLGGVDRFTAARLLAEAEGVSHSLASLRLTKDLPGDGDSVSPQAHWEAPEPARDAVAHAIHADRQVDGAAEPQAKGVNLADLSTMQRIACIIAFAVAVSIGFAVFVAAFQGVGQLSISLPG